MMQNATTARGSQRMNGSQRRALVLLAVLVVIVVLSLAGYQYSDLMTTEYSAASSAIRDMQARSFAESGIHFAAAAIVDPNNTGRLFDNPDLFRGQIVLAESNGQGQGYFSIVAPPIDPAGTSGNQSFRFGVSDESGKININALLKADRKGKVAHDILMKLPNMTDDVANAIIDWIDSDTTLRTGGAENETYGTLEVPYRTKNGPLDSFEELLLVRGITPALLFGDDRNRNGMFDAGENQAPGWAAYLTIYSREMNLDATGQPRINLNEKDVESLYTKLGPAVGEDVAKFIALVRMYGIAKDDSSNKNSGNNKGKSNKGGSSKGGGSKGGSLGGMSRGSMGFGGGKQGKSSSKRLSSIYDLIDAKVSVPSEDPKGEPTVYTSPVSGDSGMRQYLPILLDKVTTSNKTEIPARINVNTAPEAVLSALPELKANEVQAVLAARPQAGQNQDNSIAWLMTDARIPVATMKKLDKYVTGTSQVFRVQSLGYFAGGEGRKSGPTIRLEAVIDANAGRPRILYWRDLSDLGKGFDVVP